MPETIKTRSGRTIIMPTPEEEAAIQRGIDSDEDAAEIPTENIKAMRPFSELLEQKGIERPRTERQQEDVAIEYDADILDAFRATGEGWQARMNDALRTYLREHPLDAD